MTTRHGERRITRVSLSRPFNHFTSGADLRIRIFFAGSRIPDYDPKFFSEIQR